MANALLWAQRIHYFLSKARVNAFHYWYLSAAPNRRPDNEALTDSNGKVALRAYAIGQWSKFVRPGWHEVNVTHAGSALVTAFQSEDGQHSAIVVVNAEAFPLPIQFLVGSVAAHGSVVPWVTSSDKSLSRQTAVPVVHDAFSYELPPQSIVTFVGSAGSN